MKQISPVQIWKDGQLKTAELFSLRIIADDLHSNCGFYYELKSKNEDGEPDETLAVGNLTLAEPQYSEWDGSNDWAYNWASGKLSVTIL